MKKITILAIVLLLTANTFATLDWSCPGRQTLISTNNNDAYSSGRGVAFLMTQDFDLSSLGIKLDLASTAVTLEIAQITSNPINGSVLSGKSVLYTDTQIFACSEEYATFNIAESVTLESNKSYHINISHDTCARQNFFFFENTDSDGNNLGQGSQWTVGAFSLVDGTSNYNTGNTVIADFFINDTISLVSSEPANQIVPEPATVSLLAMGCLAFVRRKK
jgi:hypothetical protein